MNKAFRTKLFFFCLTDREGFSQLYEEIGKGEQAMYPVIAIVLHCP